MEITSILDLQTPAYIVKNGVLEESISSFKLALDKCFSKNILSYSVKTNSLPFILKKIREHNGYAEVVSHDEYELAKLCGFEIKNIVYNGPLKSKETFLEAVQNGAIVNIETKLEIDWLSDLPKSKNHEIGIRVNIDLRDISPTDAKENEDYSRFGFSVESGELEDAIYRIAEFQHVILAGLHVHRTTLSRSINVYQKIAEHVGELVRKYSLTLSYVDMGGGYYGIMKNKPMFHDYCVAIQKGLAKHFNLEHLTVIVEPGNAIVASAIDFVSSVIDVKKIRDFHVITTDGSRNDLDPFYKKSDYLKEVLSDNTKKEKVSLQVVSGGTCLEYDKMFEMRDSELLEAGDKIWYKSVGAYTMTLSPLFIRFFPNVYIQIDKECFLIRKKWSATDFFDHYDTDIN